MTDLDPTLVSEQLLAWYDKAGRSLPWRGTSDPYRIWLSEIMLQQTGVAAVIPYYERFLTRFPDTAALASASVEEVVELWAGLGYYSRARNLHKAAVALMEEHGGAFPATVAGLQALPGVGRSTAGAVAAIAFGVRAPILDGNVRRVLARLFALREDPRSSASEKKLWIWAETLTPAVRPGDYAQAIMDLGATLCTPRTPGCERCPLEALCRARGLGLEREIPVKQMKNKVPTVLQVALLIGRDGRLLVRRRPLEGMLGGLWEFPSGVVPEGRTPVQTASALGRDFGAGELVPAGGVVHAYSHFRLDLHLFRAEVKETTRIAEEGESRWLTPAELSDWPLHGAHKKALPLL